MTADIYLHKNVGYTLFEGYLHRSFITHSQALKLDFFFYKAIFGWLLLLFATFKFY